MNILSLFDGMSCGQIALRNLGIKVDNYYASEIDKWAIQIALKNFPNTIQMGDVTDLIEDDIPDDIDLMIAGSPCQGFSYMGDNLAFDDPRSKLFFEFVRLLEALDPTYFLLENVRMKQEHQDVITEFLGVPPKAMNSNLVSGQNRPRLYWTNIPGVCVPEQRGIKASSVIDPTNQTPNGDGWQKWWKGKSEFQLKKQYSAFLNDVEKGVCQTARQMASWNGNLVRTDSGLPRFASPLECERLQTVPDGYTEGVSNAQRYKMLGNGWTVAMIEHIFSFLGDEFPRYEGADLI